MRTVVAICLYAAVSVAPSGCFVSTVTETESFSSITTDNYSHDSAQANKAISYSSGRTNYFNTGGSTIGFFPPALSANLKAIGPIVPVIPAPGKGTSYADELFFVGVTVRPGPTSLVILEPSQYLVSVHGRGEPIAPVTVSQCNGDTASNTRLAVFGSARCFRLYFGISRGDVQRFRLIPANAVVDDVLYVFPDIDWVPTSYTRME